MREAAAFDWQGRPVRCRDCRHQAVRRSGMCQKGETCVYDQRARRVDRFFANHPELADEYLTHPYFEVRAKAALRGWMDLWPMTMLKSRPRPRLPGGTSRVLSLEPPPGV